MDVPVDAGVGKVLASAEQVLRRGDGALIVSSSMEGLEAWGFTERGRSRSPPMGSFGTIEGRVGSVTSSVLSLSSEGVSSSDDMCVGVGSGIGSSSWSRVGDGEVRIGLGLGRVTETTC